MLVDNIAPDLEKIRDGQLFRLLPCQLRYIWDDSQILGVEKGRQLGFTWISAYKILRRIFTANVAQDHYWISRDEFTAKLFLQDVITWINYLNTFRNHKKEFKTDVVDLGKEVQALRINFPNGCSIFVMSSSPNAIAGKRGHIYIDEAALHKDFRQLYDIAKPAIRWGYTLTFFSTHRSKQNYFFKLIKRIKDGEIPNAKSMTITLEDALNEGYLNTLNAKNMLIGRRIYKDNLEFFEEEKAQSSSEEIFLQENMCVPADADSSQAVTEEELDKIMCPPFEIYSPPVSGKKYYVGIDIGRNRDLSVFWVCEDVSTAAAPMLETRFIEVMNKVEFAKQERRFAELLLQWRPQKCFIDGTNIGAQIGETLAKRFPFCVDAKFTATTRPRYISDFVSFIKREPSCMKIPETNEVWEDFLSVQRFINKHGKEDFFIPSHKERGHGDRFIGAVLCLQAFLSKGTLARYTLEKDYTVQKAKPEKPRRFNKNRFKH